MADSLEPIMACPPSASSRIRARLRGATGRVQQAGVLYITFSSAWSVVRGALWRNLGSPNEDRIGNRESGHGELGRCTGTRGEMLRAAYLKAVPEVLSQRYRRAYAMHPRCYIELV